MGTLGDLLVLGEGPSIVADADVDLLGRACELLWSRAVAATGAGPHVIKLSVTAAVVVFIKVKKTNVDFWANVHRKCKRNSNFPH
jgi:hypothetical protein